MNWDRKPITVKVSSDPRVTHRILLDAPGVRDAAEAVEKAGRAERERRDERLAARLAWAERRRRNALKPDFDPGPEPNPGLEFEERQAFARQLNQAEVRLEGVVEANADEIVEAVRIREAEVMASAREALAEMQGFAAELGQLGRVLRTVASAQHRVGSPQQPRVALDDLLYLLRRHPESDAVLDFQDGRTLWLTVAARV